MANFSHPICDQALQAADIVNALHITSDHSLFSVNLIKSRLYDNKMRPINHNPKILRRTQDLANIYEENSNFYIFSKKAFLENDQKRIGKKPFMYVMDTSIEESLDLDEPKHWKLAEKIINSKLI